MAGWEFVFEIDRTRGTPVSQQIALALAAEIQRGRLRPGHRLPGSRTLARTLQVHRQTVVSAIDELIAEGWLITQPASGTFVAEGLPDPSPRRPARAARVRRSAPPRFPLPLVQPRILSCPGRCHRTRFSCLVPALTFDSCPRI